MIFRIVNRNNIRIRLNTFIHLQFTRLDYTLLKTVFWRLVRTLARWVWSSAEQSGESSQGQEAVTSCGGRRGNMCREIRSGEAGSLNCYN